MLSVPFAGNFERGWRLLHTLRHARMSTVADMVFVFAMMFKYANDK